MAAVTRFRDLAEVEQTDGDKKNLSLILKAMSDLRLMLSGAESDAVEQFAERYDVEATVQALDYVGVVLGYMAHTTKMQNIFETETLSERIEKTLGLLQEHVHLRVALRTLQKEAMDKTANHSETHMLKDLSGLLRTKMGLSKDAKETQRAKYKKNLEGKTVPKHIQKLIDEELDRFSTVDQHTSEFHVISTYLEWLTCLPYGVSSQETLDLDKARSILDRDHYGLSDVKDRILEFIAVSKLRGSSCGKILCFTGPPGVGKTSIAKSIAEALNRKYFRICLGGMDDVAELKGHRRTYIGAQPGKLISALKQCAADNPVLLFDEVDKLGRRAHAGSAESALLEVLDPQQNAAFCDHYLDAQVDLSKVLFICTANLLEEVSPALVDRMESIEVKGYTAEEKLAIFEKHLWTRALKDLALEQYTPWFYMSYDAKELLIREYCRDAGVRRLQKVLTRLLEKVAVNVLKETHSAVTTDTLKHYAGHPPFSSKKMYETLPAGVVMGLAYTAMGGTPLYIEVAPSSHLPQSKPELKATGSIKPVMSESIQIAYTYAKSVAEAKRNGFLDSVPLHLHFPEGAVEKDGPSAGVTITTALLSLAFDRAVVPDLAMTGEISLTGRVLPISGLKEKVVAARREGVKTVIIPQANQHSWHQLPDTLKEGISVHFAQTYPDVLKVALPSVHSI